MNEFISLNTKFSFYELLKEKLGDKAISSFLIATYEFDPELLRTFELDPHFNGHILCDGKIYNIHRKVEAPDVNCIKVVLKQGRFHPKMYFFETPDDLHFFFGSANLTDGGFRYNREIIAHWQISRSEKQSKKKNTAKITETEKMIAYGINCFQKICKSLISDSEKSICESRYFKKNHIEEIIKKLNSIKNYYSLPEETNNIFFIKGLKNNNSDMKFPSVKEYHLICSPFISLSETKNINKNADIYFQQFNCQKSKIDEIKKQYKNINNLHYVENLHAKVYLFNDISGKFYLAYGSPNYTNNGIGGFTENIDTGNVETCLCIPLSNIEKNKLIKGFKNLGASNDTLTDDMFDTNKPDDADPCPIIYDSSANTEKKSIEFKCDILNIPKNDFSNTYRVKCDKVDSGQFFSLNEIIKLNNLTWGAHEEIKITLNFYKNNMPFNEFPEKDQDREIKTNKYEFSFVFPCDFDRTTSELKTLEEYLNAAIEYTPLEKSEIAEDLVALIQKDNGIIEDQDSFFNDSEEYEKTVQFIRQVKKMARNTIPRQRLDNLIGFIEKQSEEFKAQNKISKDLSKLCLVSEKLRNKLKKKINFNDEVVKQSNSQDYNAINILEKSIENMNKSLLGSEKKNFSLTDNLVLDRLNYSQENKKSPIIVEFHEPDIKDIQKETLKKINEIIKRRNSDKRGIIVAEQTGFGKTFIMLECIEKIIRQKKSAKILLISSRTIINQYRNPKSKWLFDMDFSETFLRKKSLYEECRKCKKNKLCNDCNEYLIRSYCAVCDDVRKCGNERKCRRGNKITNSDDLIKLLKKEREEKGENISMDEFLKFLCQGAFDNKTYKNFINLIKKYYYNTGNLNITTYTSFVKKFDSLYKKKWDYIIVDEAHNMLNNNRYNCLYNLTLKTNKDTPLLLLTATPFSLKAERELYRLSELVIKGDFRIQKHNLDDVKPLKENDDQQNFSSVLKSGIKKINEVIVKIDNFFDLLQSENFKVQAETLARLYATYYILLDINANADIADLMNIKNDCKNLISKSQLKFGYKSKGEAGLDDMIRSFVVRHTENMIKTRDNMSFTGVPDYSKCIQMPPLSPQAYYYYLNAEYEARDKLLSCKKENECTTILNAQEKMIKKLGEKAQEHFYKFSFIIDTLNGIIANGEKAIVFAERLETLKLIHSKLKNKSFLLYDDRGRKNRKNKKNRDSQLEKFKKNHPKSKNILLLCRKGSEGLNLQSTKHLFHFDLWFNPSRIIQRNGRALRIGQNKPVSLYYLIQPDTYDIRLFYYVKTRSDMFNILFGVQAISAARSQSTEFIEEFQRAFSKLRLRDIDKNRVVDSIKYFANDGDEKEKFNIDLLNNEKNK